MRLVPVTARALSIFTGAGGLDLGLERAGFEIAGCVEIDSDCRSTVCANRDWRLITPADVNALDATTLLRQAGVKRGEAAILSAGPPCQPFSKAAQWQNGTTRGMLDARASSFR